MKFIQLFILCLVISVFVAEHAQRKSHKIKKASTTFLKSGAKSHANLNDKYWFRINVDGYEKSDGYVTMSTFKTPTGKYSNGMYFETTKRDSPLDKIAVLDGTNIFIPYRLCGSCTYGNPWVDRRWVQFTCTANSKSYLIFLEFERFTGNDSDQKSICQYFDSNVNASKSAIRTYKSTSSSQTTIYIDKSALADAAGRDKATADALVKSLQDDVTTLNNDMNTISASQATITTQIEEANKNLEALVSKDSKYSTDDENFKTLKSQNENTIKSLQGSITDAQASKDRFNTAMNEAQAEYTKNSELLRKCTYGETSAIITAANTEFLNGNQAKVLEQLALITTS